jgi:hypothetical protein
MMRMVLVAATLVCVTACDRTSENKAVVDPLVSANATAPASGVASTAPPAPQALEAPPSRVSGPPDPKVAMVDSETDAQRGGISRALSGVEGGGAAANRGALMDNLTGRWAYNCNTGAGPLVFHPDGRFTAPGGSGRFQARDQPHFDIVFTFEDGGSETWGWSMEPGSLSLQRKGGGGSISRVLCSATP